MADQAAKRKVVVRQSFRFHPVGVAKLTTSGRITVRRALSYWTPGISGSPSSHTSRSMLTA